MEAEQTAGMLGAVFGAMMGAGAVTLLFGFITTGLAALISKVTNRTFNYWKAGLWTGVLTCGLWFFLGDMFGAVAALIVVLIFVGQVRHHTAQHPS